MNTSSRGRRLWKSIGIYAPDWRIYRRIGMSGSLFLQELLRETGQKASKTKMKAIEDLHRKHFARKIAGIQPLPGAEDLARISNLNSPYEPSGVRWHLYLCGFGRGEDALEVHTQWVRNKTIPFSSSSMLP
jgi:hypothetical protein